MSRSLGAMFTSEKRGCGRVGDGRGEDGHRDEELQDHSVGFGVKEEVTVQESRHPQGRAENSGPSV